MVEREKNQKQTSTSAVFKLGAISLAFLIVGYQVALFVHKAAVTRIVANRDEPDTVFVYRDNPAVTTDVGDGSKTTASRDEAEDGSISSETATTYRKSNHSEAADKVWSKAPKKVESFRFNPNTVSMNDLQRLGFSEKQAQSIINYREKGGRFRRKSDFAKSFVVADSVYKRLEPYIVIPKVDINKADSAAFDELPGIGGYFARKMVEYREQLGGYSCPEQLMEIYHFDAEKYNGLKDLITCSARDPYPFWEADVETLKSHPHIRSWQTAKAIVLYRDNNPRDLWTIDALLSAGILTPDQATKLRRCKLK